MKHRIMMAVGALVTLLLMHSALPTTLAQNGGTYDLSWNTLDGGGATFATGGVYSLGGTIGQADASTLSGGAYTLAGGFWAGVTTGGAVYLPLVVR